MPRVSHGQSRTTRHRRSGPMFAQVNRKAGRPNFQAGHAGSIPVIRSLSSRLMSLIRLSFRYCCDTWLGRVPVACPTAWAAPSVSRCLCSRFERRSACVRRSGRWPQLSASTPRLRAAAIAGDLPGIGVSVESERSNSHIPPGGSLITLPALSARPRRTLAVRPGTSRRAGVARHQRTGRGWQSCLPVP